MPSSQPRSPAWRTAVVGALAVWAIGSYLPAVSNIWAQLNLIAPAGAAHLFTFPMAYPAVGADAATLCSLLGCLIILGAAVRWVTYWQWHTAADPTSSAAPGPSSPR